MDCELGFHGDPSASTPIPRPSLLPKLSKNVPKIQIHLSGFEPRNQKLQPSIAPPPKFPILNEKMWRHLFLEGSLIPTKGEGLDQSRSSVIHHPLDVVILIIIISQSAVILRVTFSHRLRRRRRRRPWIFLEPGARLFPSIRFYCRRSSP